MNKDLSEFILTSIARPAYIDRWCGVVQTLNVQNKNLPAGNILVGAECGLNGKPSAIIPDSNYKGILYFEDKGLTPTKGLSTCYGFISNLRMVCWLNNKRIGFDTNTHSVSTYAMTDLIKLINKNLNNSNVFLQVRPNVTGIAIQDAAIFSKYDFDDKMSGYLQGDFSYFAIDLAINFYISKTCTIPMILTPSNC